MTEQTEEPKTRQEYAMAIRECIGVISGAERRLEDLLQDLSTKDRKAYLVKTEPKGKRS